MKEHIDNFIKNIDEYIYPSSSVPIYKVISSFGIGLIFGIYHNAFILTIISNIIFECIYKIATRNRPGIYSWKLRAICLLSSILGILFSKFIWGNRPIFKLLL